MKKSSSDKKPYLKSLCINMDINMHGDLVSNPGFGLIHDDVIKWKHFLRYWPFVRGIHRSTVKSPHKGQWRGALMFSLICVWINGWVNNRAAGDLRRWINNRNPHGIIHVKTFLILCYAYLVTGIWFISLGVNFLEQNMNTRCLQCQWYTPVEYV